MHRADMMMLGGLADALMGDLQALRRIGREPHGLADRRIVERLVIERMRATPVCAVTAS